jgi:hypothetical protein
MTTVGAGRDPRRGLPTRFPGASEPQPKKGGLMYISIGALILIIILLIIFVF